MLAHHNRRHSSSLDGGALLHGYFRYLVRLQSGQHLSAKPAQLLYEHGVWHSSPVEVQEQRVGAHALGLGN